MDASQGDDSKEILETHKAITSKRSIRKKEYSAKRNLAKGIVIIAKKDGNLAKLQEMAHKSPSGKILAKVRTQLGDTFNPSRYLVERE
jgi:hypothetical protein